MTVTSIFEVQLKPDAVETGLAVVHKILADTRAFDGNLGVSVLQDHADPTHVVAIEHWESLEHDAAYREWRAGPGAATELRELLAAPPRLSICTDIAQL